MAPLNLLIVEDSTEDRHIYRRLLTRNEQGFNIFEADNSYDGLALSQKHNIDCVILDYNLPGMDGLDFLTTFKELSQNPDAAIIMVTGVGNEKTAVEAMKGGAADYITKDSLHDSYFVQTILNAIERSQLRKKVLQYQEHLEQSNQALSEFTHTVSHDLKAPLRRIKAFCELLDTEYGKNLGPEGRKYTQRLVANADNAQKLIDDLLSYSRILHAREDKEPTDLKQLLKEVVEDLRSSIEESRASITIDDDLPTLPVYPTKVRQLFLNLIINAIKYHSESDPVIHISCEPVDGGYIFIVQDNGVGIPPEFHKDIFKEFQRLHSNDAIEGTGLGLSICKKVVDQHGGDIWVKSDRNKGSKFYFILPLSKQSSAAAPEEQAVTAS